MQQCIARCVEVKCKKRRKKTFAKLRKGTTRLKGSSSDQMVGYEQRREGVQNFKVEKWKM